MSYMVIQYYKIELLVYIAYFSNSNISSKNKS